MLSAVELHLSITDKLEDSYKFSKKYYSLATDLYKVIKLKPEERSERGGDYLGRMFTEYTKLAESSEMMHHSMKNDVLTRIPKGLIEYKRTPTYTPEGSLEENDVDIFKHFPHSSSLIFKRPGSPLMKEQYYDLGLKDEDVKVTEEEDLESNLSK